MSRGEALTKDQIREQLIIHGIELPSAKAPKSAYVDLYNSKIRTNTGAFSSDDETVEVKSSSSRRSRRKTKADEDSSAASDDFDSLSNTELAALLKKNGIQYGPIGKTTRQVYIKKLLRASQDAVSKMEPQYSDEENEEEKEREQVQVTRSSSRRRTMQLSDIQPQVETRRSMSLKARAPILPDVSIISSASATSKRKSMAVTRQEERFLSTQPATSLCRSTPNLFFANLSAHRNLANESGERKTPPMPARKGDSELASGGPAQCELTPSWVNVSLSEYDDKPDIKIKRSPRDSTGFTMDQLSDNEEGFDVIEDCTVAAINFSNNSENITAIEKTVLNETVAVHQEKALSRTPVATSASKKSVAKPNVPSIARTPASVHSSKKTAVKLGTPASSIKPIQFTPGAHVRTSTMRPESLASPSLVVTDYSKRAQLICSSATRRRPLRTSRLAQRETPSPIKGEKSATPAKLTQNDSATDGKAKKPTSPDRRLVPVWIQIVVALIAAAFFYLVYQYLEANPSPPSLPNSHRE